MGFYSAFLVADRVTLLTRSHEEEGGWIWTSEAGSHEFKVKRDDGSAGAPMVGGLGGWDWAGPVGAPLVGGGRRG